VLKFYYHLSPNPLKVALFLEEAGLPYELVPVDTIKGEQFAPSYLALNPNGKTPVIIDEEVVVFDSTAILMYLADKTRSFLPETTDRARGQLLSWLMFVASGVGPFAGQAVHFQRFSPEAVPYALNRYMYEADRHFRILDAQLGRHRYMLGDTYTVVDMSVWGWARAVSYVLGAELAGKLTNLNRLVEEINARPAAARVAQLYGKHAFKTEIDEEGRRILFPHTARRIA
jgi:GSH-dependent disulfide-bond oxidoreductase